MTCCIYKQGLRFHHNFIRTCLYISTGIYLLFDSKYSYDLKMEFVLNKLEKISQTKSVSDQMSFIQWSIY